MVLFHLPIEGKHLPRFEAITEVGGIEPEAAQAGPALAGGHVEDGHAAGTEQARVAHFRDDSSHFAGAKFGDAARIDPVFVTERQVMQQIVYSLKAFGS